MNRRGSDDLDLRPIAPFWFWNGDMEEGEIERQIAEMDDQGVGAFIICARQGLKIPYLSALWFDRVRVAVEAAKRRRMDVWLYDDQPYPSLAGAGRVVLDHPEFEAKELRYHVLEVGADESVVIDLDWGEVLLARAYPLGGGPASEVDWESPVDLSGCVGQLFAEEVFHETGLTKYNRKRFLACEPYLRLNWTGGGSSARRLVYVFCQVPVRGHKYFDRFTDPLNPAAVRYFLKTTHERYAAEFGEDFGGTIKGIFTDEIHPIGFEGSGVPWSPLLPSIYSDRYGEELLPLLPALVDDRWPDPGRIRYRFMDAVTESFIASYDEQVSSWCAEHGIRFIGEKPILRSSQLRYFDVPGIDAGHQKAGGDPEVLPARYRANPRILSSAAHFYGKTRCLCESFHSIGWGMDIQDMKWTYDWLAMQGVNLFVNHAYYYTTANLAKHDAPPSSFIQMPWWPYQKLLSSYTEGLVRATPLSDRKPRILALDTISSRWTVAFGKAEEREAVGAAFSRTLRLLFENHFDFWVIDSQLLQSATVSDGRLFIGDEGYDCLVLPPVRNLEDGAYAACRRLLDGGGTVVACGPAPAERIGEVGVEEIGRLWADCRRVADPDGLPTALDSLGLRDLSVTDAETGSEQTALHATLFCGDGGLRVFAQNPYAERRRVVVSIRSGGKERRSGVLEFGPFESRFLPFGSVAKIVDELHSQDGADIPTVELPVDAELPLRLLGPNALRLDEWELEVGGESARVRAMPIVDQMAASGLRLPVRRTDRFGTPKTLLFSPVSAIYRTRFAAEGFSGGLELLLEPGGIGGDFEVRFNGLSFAPDAFRRKTRGGIVVDVLPLGPPRPGSNVVEIRVRAERSGDGLRTPIHLAGDFAVRGHNRERVLGPPPTAGRPLNPGSAGLPYYAGSLRYSGVFAANGPRPGALRLRIGDARWRSACRLAVNGRDLGSRAWHPFEWTLTADAVLSGENSFELEVAGNRLGYFEGQYYDAAEDRYRSYEA